MAAKLNYKKIAAMPRGEKVCLFIETYCKVPEGKHVGKPIKLEPFQRKFILAVYDNPHGTSRAYLSIARKNGKTALIAGICLAHIVGPVALRNSQIISGARSRDQAALLFKLMQKMVALEPELQRITRVLTSAKIIVGLPLNVEYRAISAEAKTAHGASPVVAVLDEVGQIRGPKDEFVDAIETSQGAYEAPLLIAISTQAANDDDLFSIWLDDAEAGQDPHIVSHVYKAEKDADLMDEAAWAAANPALGTFRSLADMRTLATKAQRMPSFVATFRNLNLNQRVEMNTPFISRDVWLLNSKPPADLAKKKVFGGLDLASVADLAALVLVSEDNDIEPTFWTPKEGVFEKAKADRVPYDVWANQGFIQLTPGRTIQYEFIAAHLRAVFDSYDVQSIGFDRYNMKFLRPWLVKAGFSEAELTRFVEFGQGFVSMSPALRELESRLLECEMKHGAHPVLTWCAANAVVLTDPAGNRKLAKNRGSGRIDGMVALAMAVGVMPIKVDAPPPPPKYNVSFV